ncbi:TIGR04452 family lipoprotein [Leptospira perolatii]|uniref:TIGR04452 family lipoprotein n=1 Tax=Leptospira perolatii TaxID=2023191 RepID=UPI0024342027|nr:TIGR04452 family lipoprotein [Leptospira perolatii]
MKKILTIFFFVLGASVANCAAFDAAGVSGSMKGTEAAQKINDAALQTDILYFAATTGQPNFFISSLYTAEAAKVEPDKYYKKTDVDKCISNIKTIGLMVLTPNATALFTCSLKPNGAII